MRALLAVSVSIVVLKASSQSFETWGICNNDKSGQTSQGSFPAGWLAGKPDYPQKLEVLEVYEKSIEYRNLCNIEAKFYK